EEDVDPIEPGAVDLRRSGQVEHRIQVDGRLGAGAPFADNAGPHRVMEFRVFVGMAATHGKPLSKKERNVRAIAPWGSITDSRFPPAPRARESDLCQARPV